MVLFHLKYLLVIVMYVRNHTSTRIYSFLVVKKITNSAMTVFAQSCTAKMNGNEILTCAMCAYQLIEGEIKQLRLPAEQKTTICGLSNTENIQ